MKSLSSNQPRALSSLEACVTSLGYFQEASWRAGTALKHLIGMGIVGATAPALCI